MSAAAIKQKICEGKLVTGPNDAGKAAIWRHYDLVLTSNKELSGYVQCRACKAVLAYDSKKTGTSSLQRHTDRGCTRSTAAANVSSYKQTSVSDYLSPPAKSVPASVRSSLTEKCVEFCCRDIRSFHTVAGRGFVDLAQDLINVGATYGRVSAESVLPDPTTISRRCKEAAASKRQTVVKEISDILCDINVGMTTDMWTDDYRKNSFLTITCHYITPDFLLRSRVLTTVMFPPEEAKTGDNIRRELQHQLVSVLGFDACVMNKVVWVTDQGSNMIAALAPYHRLDCQDHVYNTVLRRALDCDELRDCAPEITQTLLAAKTLVRYVKQTGIINQLTKTVRQMSDTRFSTVFLTLDSIKQVYTELREKLDNRGESRRIDEVSPDVLEFLLDFLRPFYQAQRELEGDQYPTLNLVVLWHERLKRHWRPVASDSSHQAIIRNRHLEWLNRKIKIETLHKLAIFLWPKFCQLRMLSPPEREDIHQESRRRIASFTGGGEPAGEPASKRSKTVVAEFEEWVNVPLNETVDEVHQYISRNHDMEEERDLLGWWKNNSGVFPLLSRLARSIFSIPASSSSSERNFSAAGLTFNQRRTALKPSTVDALLFLHNAY